MVIRKNLIKQIAAASAARGVPSVLFSQQGTGVLIMHKKAIVQVENAMKKYY